MSACQGVGVCRGMTAVGCARRQSAEDFTLPFVPKSATSLLFCSVLLCFCKFKSAGLYERWSLQFVCTTVL